MNQQRPRGMRPVLLLVVYGVFLVVVGVTATLQTGLLSLHFSTAAMNATVAADAAIVRTFANGELTSSDLSRARARRSQRRASRGARGGSRGPGDARGPRADRHPEPIGRDPPVDPAGRARHRGAGGRRVRRRGPRGATNAGILNAGMPTGIATGATADHPVLQAYLPLIDANGSTDAIAAVWRDAAPIVGALGHVQEQMLAVTLVAAAVAGLLLYLVFRGAQVRIARQTVELLEATRRDPLTGLLNHGAMAAELAAADRPVRTDLGAIGVALIDLDNFRLLNDTHGHAGGDDALLRLARLVELHRPPGTTTGRFGPDEFLVVAPAASIAALRPAIEQLRHALVDESLQFEAIDAAGAITRNSSGPNRPVVARSGRWRSTSRARRSSASSPAAWPCVSLRRRRSRSIRAMNRAHTRRGDHGGCGSGCRGPVVGVPVAGVELDQFWRAIRTCAPRTRYRTSAGRPRRPPSTSWTCPSSPTIGAASRQTAAIASVDPFVSISGRYAPPGGRRWRRWPRPWAGRGRGSRRSSRRRRRTRPARCTTVPRTPGCVDRRIAPVGAQDVDPSRPARVARAARLELRGCAHWSGCARARSRSLEVSSPFANATSTMRRRRQRRSALIAAAREKCTESSRSAASR